MRPRQYGYGPLMAASAFFVLGLVGLFALPIPYRAGAFLGLAVAGGLVFLRVFVQRRPAPFPAPRPQAQEIELRTLDQVRDANLISRDDYEGRNDEILQREP